MKSNAMNYIELKKITNHNATVTFEGYFTEMDEM